MAELIPPPPEFSGIVYAVTGGMFVLGVVLLLWGRTVGRAVLGLACGAVAAFLAGGVIAAKFSFPLIPTQISVGISALVLGALLARGLWALLAGALLAAGALCGLWALVMSRSDVPVFPPDAYTLEAWLRAVGALLGGMAQAMWDKQLLYLMLTGIPAALIAIIVCLLYPRAAVIAVTAILGGLLMTFGAGTFVVKLRSTLWESAADHPAVPGGVALLLALIGIVFQVRAEKAAKKKAKDKAKPPGGDKAPKK